MTIQDKFKQVDIKIFVVPFLIITLIFLLTGYITINGVKNLFYNHIKEDSIEFAKTYSHNFSKATEAYDVVNKLLEDKLLVASRTTVLYDRRLSNELLKELADTLEVDEINSFNPQGEILYSNIVELTGWKTYEGHPVCHFMNSNSITHVEDIRQSTETGIYYKYGYFKVPDGSFVQIGVRADKIHNFLGSFETQQLLNEMQQVGVAAQISFMDNDFNVIGSTDNRLIGQEMTNQLAKRAILESREYADIYNYKGKEEYIVFVPVYFEEVKIGTLSIGQSLINTKEAVRRVSIIGLVTLLVVYMVLLYSMISTYKKNRMLIQLAYYDTVTGLPNNLYLKEYITEKIGKKEENTKALLLINCCNFRTVNLTYGYEYGDELLREISRKIGLLVDSNQKLFRFTADRFVLYVENYGGQTDLLSTSKKISTVFHSPFKVNDAEQHLNVQVGIVEIGSNCVKVDRLLKDASISLSYIKSNDCENYVFFNEEMANRIQREDLVEKELRTIILNNNTNKLYLEFQPQLDLKTDRVTCFEALARVRTESLGFISPLEFIDIAERKQLIIPLSNLILKDACDFISTLKIEGYSDVKVAVNISGIQLLRDDFIDTVLDIIKETDIEESSLELEITESVLLDNSDIINAKLKTLRDHEIGIALDDFGTGYSSFSRLGELNIDIVKIDQYFISKISIKGNKALIIGDIISMAHKLGLAVVAEGVEVKAQKEHLIKKECDFIQGYLFSKPLPKEKAIELLKTRHK